MKRPNRFKIVFSTKFFYRQSQMVIVGDVKLDEIVEVKYKGEVYSSKEQIAGLVEIIKKC